MNDISTRELDAPAARTKCLVVDDLPENLLALSALLTRDDVEILTASSGAEALDLLLSHDIALALLDVQMPEMDGFELAELMRGSERTRHIPLIFVTAAAREAHRLFKGYELGAVDFLYKPIEPQILKSKADVFFQLHFQKQQLSRELAERTKMLRLNEVFAAVLGHDLRTPLGAMLTGARLLEMHANDAELVRRTAARVRSSGERMGRMIEDLLDLTRTRLAGGLALRIERVNWDALVRHVVEEQQIVFPGRAIETEVAGDPFGEGDPERLAQVVSNLAGNALQHGDAAEPVRIRFDGGMPESVLLSVANAGGIAADELPRMFEPFRGRHHTAHRGQGLGLGLYITHEIVQAHGGTVDAQSADGTHTVMRVRIPRPLGALNLIQAR